MQSSISRRSSSSSSSMCPILERQKSLLGQSVFCNSTRTADEFSNGIDFQRLGLTCVLTSYYFLNSGVVAGGRGQSFVAQSLNYDASVVVSDELLGHVRKLNYLIIKTFTRFWGIVSKRITEYAFSSIKRTGSQISCLLMYLDILGLDHRVTGLLVKAKN